MKVILNSVGNPDLRQDPSKPLFGCEANKTVEVKTFKEASDACIDFINSNLLGSGNWSGGDILNKGKLIAYVSYNGRVWEVSSGTSKHDMANKEIPLNK